MKPPDMDHTGLRGKFSALAGSLVGLAAVLALVGWTFRIPSLTDATFHAVPMHPITAVLFAILSFAMLLDTGRQSSARQKISLIYAAFVALAGLARIGCYLAHIEGVDSSLLFQAELQRISAEMAPTRIQVAPNTALCFAFLGAALFVILLGLRRLKFVALFLIFPPALLALLTIGGHFIHVNSLGSLVYEVPMSLATGVVFFILAAGLLARLSSNSWYAVSDGAESSANILSRSMDGSITVGFAVAMFMLCAIGIISCKSISQLISDARWSNHTYQVIAEINALYAHVKDAEKHARGYVITGDEAHLVSYHAAVNALEPSVQKLKSLTLDNSYQQQRLDELDAGIQHKLEIVQDQVQLCAADPQALARQSMLADEGKAVMDGLQPIVQGMRQDEDHLLGARLAETEASAHRSIILIVGESIISLILVILAGWLIRRDIAGRMRAEAHLQNKTHQLQAANKELEAFSYSVSHDLRTPLRSLDGFSRALLEDYADKLDAEGQDHLQRIRAASQRMGHLIDDLLNLSKVTRVAMSLERVDLSKLALDVITNLHGAEPARKVDVVVADKLWANADSHLIRIVLDNLLGNAWKFTAKAVRPRIEFGCSTDNGTRSYFVRDNGAGFDMTYSNKLFGAFQRLHAATDFPGTGIGLATVQRIIHRHAGRVWAEGAVNSGATFHFTL